MNRLAVVALALLLPACTDGAPEASSSPTSTAPSSHAPSASSPSPSAPVTASPSGSPTPAATPVPASFSPRSASFLSPTVGWVLGRTAAAGTATVVVTRDGGTTWSTAGTIPVQVGADADLRDHVSSIRFLSDTVGWAYGSTSYVTRDGGATWRKVAMPQGRTLVSIAASGTETYALLGTKLSEHLVEDAAIWKGTVDGDTVTRADAAGAVLPFEDVTVRGRTVLYEVGRDYPGTAYRVSNDAGRTWETRAPCARDEKLQDVTASTANDLVFSCFGDTTRTLRVSADGGRTTTLRLREPKPRTETAFTVAAASPTAITRVVDRTETRPQALQWSSDGGRTFRTVGPAPAPGGTTMWLEPRFVTASFGTVRQTVANGTTLTSALYVTTDGGATWAPLPVR